MVSGGILGNEPSPVTLYIPITKARQGLKFDMCVHNIFLVSFYFFFLLNISRPSLTCACTQAGTKNVFSQILFGYGDFQDTCLGVRVHCVMSHCTTHVFEIYLQWLEGRIG